MSIEITPTCGSITYHRSSPEHLIWTQASRTLLRRGCPERVPCKVSTARALSKRKRYVPLLQSEHPREVPQESHRMDLKALNRDPDAIST